MTARHHRIFRRRSVLLEYTLLVCSILPIVFASSALVYAPGWAGGSFGTLGKGVVAFYQRVVTIISLPIP